MRSAWRQGEKRAGLAPDGMAAAMAGTVREAGSEDMDQLSLVISCPCTSIMAACRAGRAGIDDIGRYRQNSKRQNSRSGRLAMLTADGWRTLANRIRARLWRR
jgi:hypothetical protein